MNKSLNERFGSYQKTILENGLRVVTETHQWAKTVQMGFFIEAGTRHELDGQMGMAHLIEHMVFKGSKTKNALELVLDIEKAGADINAHTSKEYTCYTTTGLKESIPLCLATLKDLVFNADFKDAEFEREKNVVIQEIDMSKDNLEDYIFDMFFENWLGSHPVGRNILGTKDTVSSITMQNLVDFYTQCYQPEKMILAVTGPITHEELLTIVNELALGSLRKSDPNMYPLSERPPNMVFSGFKDWQSRPSEQAHLVVGLPSVSFLHPKRFESYVLSSYLGGGMTSRLYQVIREQKGWAYNIYTYLQSFIEGGSLAIYMGAAPENVVSILELLNEEFKLLLKNGISEDDLNLYKTQVKAGIMMGMDDLENRMNSIGVNEMIFRKYRSSEDVIRDIEKISVKSFNEMLPSGLIADQVSTLCLGDNSQIGKKIEKFNNFKWSF